jgi:hypothetical protein
MEETYPEGTLFLISAIGFLGPFPELENWAILGTLGAHGWG